MAKARKEDPFDKLNFYTVRGTTFEERISSKGKKEVQVVVGSQEKNFQFYLEPSGNDFALGFIAIMTEKEELKVRCVEYPLRHGGSARAVVFYKDTLDIELVKQWLRENHYERSG